MIDNKKSLEIYKNKSLIKNNYLINKHILIKNKLIKRMINKKDNLI